MSHWTDAAKKFEENSYQGLYFETQSVLKTLNQIQTTLKHSFPQMIFLLGEPGSGKSFMLNHLKNYYKDRRKCLMIENPYISPIELLKRMLGFMDIQNDGDDVEMMRIQAIKAYKDIPHIIMIDEAQLTNPPLREFIRILSDSKSFWFLIAMHTAEGEQLLKSTHFYSRPHQVFYMGHLQLHECKPYLQKALYDLEIWGFIMDLSDKLIKKSWTYCHGNFRNFKKFYYNLFLLLEYAHLNNKTKFLQPNSLMMTMVAIKAGLLQTSKRTNDFDELVKVSKQLNLNKKAIFGISSVLILLSVLIFGVLKFYNSSSAKTTKIEANATKQRLKPKAEKKLAVVHEEKQIITHEETNITNQPIQSKVENEIEIKPTKPTIKPIRENKLKFYPPTKQNIQTNLKPQIENEEEIILEKSTPEEEIVIIEPSQIQTQEPNFLDIQEKPSGPLFKLKEAKPKHESKLIKEYENNPSYDLALQIADIFYAKKYYSKASSWARKANLLDKEQERAWIVFAQSEYKLGNKNDAKKALKLFLQNKDSKQAKQLLRQWSRL